MKILVTGSKGQLGSEIKLLGPSQPHEYTFVDIEEMDLSKDSAIEDFFRDRTFDFVINCAAYTAVDKAEDDSTLAFRINSLAVKTIASICARKSIRLIHISTDYVFDGEGNVPINESTTPAPLSVYGRSKLEGEQHVQSILKNAYIIRTAWVYSTFGKNFVKTIAKLASEKDSLNVVYDQIGSPTYARDLAKVIIEVVHKIHSKQVDIPGLYHYTNEGVISWYDFAYFIAKYYGYTCQINAIPTSGYKTLALRPKYSVLDKNRLKDTFSIVIPHWHQSLAECLAELAR